MDGYLYDILCFENNEILEDLDKELNIKEGSDNDSDSDKNY